MSEKKEEPYTPNTEGVKPQVHPDILAQVKADPMGRQRWYARPEDQKSNDKAAQEKTKEAHHG